MILKPGSGCLRSVCRHMSSQWQCAPLTNRAIIAVSGSDSASFLQGLMTNDLDKIVTDQWRSLYCMFLNTQGRVLFDAIVYKGQNEDDFLLDVDSKVSAVAKKHLGFYKVRRKVKLELCERLGVFAAYQESASLSPVTSDGQMTQSPVLGSTFCSAGSLAPETQLVSGHGYPDPRLSALGTRLVLDTADNDTVTQHVPAGTAMVTQDSYHQHRCDLGIAEGVAELGLAKVTPLEYNLDYLNGVSFHKGCYIGQELTARTHHTGVIRKRILPLKFRGDQLTLSEGEELSVVNDKGKNVGKVKRVMGDIGLGLMRLKESFEADKLTVNDDIEVFVRKPGWWPQDKDLESSKSSS